MGSTKDACSTTKTATSKPAALATLPQYFLGSYGTMYYVQNLKKSVSFYRDTIGLTAQCEDEGWAQFDLNGTALCLHPAGDKKITTGGGTLIIEVSDIRKAVGQLKEKRVEFLGEVNDMGECGMCAEFKDLDGNVISLYQKPAGAPVRN
jgi:predicted enzyme related to lactoylglutathione lyase